MPKIWDWKKLSEELALTPGEEVLAAELAPASAARNARKHGLQVRTEVLVPGKYNVYVWMEARS